MDLGRMPSRSPARPTAGALSMILLAAAIGGPIAPVSAQERAARLTVGTLAGPIDAGSGGLEVDAEGNVYTADFGATLSNGPPGTRVWRSTPGGDVSVFAEGLRGASGNTIGPDGWFYQSNIAASTISRIAPDGTVEPFVTEGIRGPVGIVFDEGGDLIVANCGANSLSRVSPDGVARPLVSSELLACPNGITLAGDGHFYVANFANGDVIRVSPDGEATRFVTVPGDNNGHIVWGNGVLYVVARGAHQIYELTLDGELTLLAGSGERGLDDGPADRASLSLPNDVALSPDGRVLYWNDVGELDPADGQTLGPTWIRYVELGGADGGF